jgi:hypothetical protein
MKYLVKIFFIVLFFSIASKARSSEIITNPGEKTGGTNDTTSELKSNIMIFKMINTPPPTNSNKSGGLKKAGKVARTSYEHFTIDTLIFQKKPI